MKILLILGHPDGYSLNADFAHTALKGLVGAGHRVIFHDLYEEGFDPVLPLEDLRRRSSFDPLPAVYAAELRQADGLLVIHPDWWGLPPAIIKGWVDRVFLPGVAYAYEPERDVPTVPLLSDKKAFVLVTRDGDRPGLSADFWTALVFSFCGIRDSRILELGPLKTLSPSERAEQVKAAYREVSLWFGA